MGLLFLAVPEPVAFYPLNARYKAAEKENRQTNGLLKDVAVTTDPTTNQAELTCFTALSEATSSFQIKNSKAWTLGSPSH